MQLARKVLHVPESLQSLPLGDLPIPPHEQGEETFHQPGKAILLLEWVQVLYKIAWLSVFFLALSTLSSCFGALQSVTSSTKEVLEMIKHSQALCWQLLKAQSFMLSLHGLQPLYSC